MLRPILSNDGMRISNVDLIIFGRSLHGRKSKYLPYE